jgi:ribose/xylose/arabinose/galactoside ABC-type transport system permease subunit
MGRQPAFNAEPAFVLVATIAFIAGMGWALGVLRRAVDFPSFIVLGACGIALMISLGYTWDWLAARHSQQLPPAAPPDR